MKLDSLFRPGRIGRLELANRIIKSPQSTLLAQQDGTVSQRLVNHYRRLAEGGPGPGRWPCGAPVYGRRSV